MMFRLDRARLRRLAPAAVLVAIVSVLVIPVGTSQAASPPAGLDCATSSSNAFSLTAAGGYISTPDGNSIYMWSYGLSGGSFQLPGPTLCVTSGVTVTGVPPNTLAQATSITF